MMTGASIAGSDLALADALGRILAKRCTVANASEVPDDTLHADLATGGWFELFGLGTGPDGDIAVSAAIAAAEQLGVYLAPISIVLAAGLLLPLLRALEGVAPAASLLCDRIENGEILACAIPVVDPETASQTLGDGLVGTATAGGHHLTGRLGRVLRPDGAEDVVVPVTLEDGTRGIAVVRMDQDGIEVSSRDTVVSGVRSMVLGASGALVSPENLVAAPEFDRALRRAAISWSLLLDAHAVGICAAVLDRTISYVTSREQFGKPIGGFQAVQHMVADIYIALETSRSILMNAVKLNQQDPDGAINVALVSRLHCSNSAKLACELAIQSHGGSGFTWEVGLHEWYRAASFSRQYLSDRTGSRQLLGRHLRSDPAYAGVA
jgi:alkylation response protein AidB-like acyl-CoA dehydrogenase